MHYSSLLLCIKSTSSIFLSYEWGSATRGFNQSWKKPHILSYFQNEHLNMLRTSLPLPQSRQLKGTSAPLTRHQGEQMQRIPRHRNNLALEGVCAHWFWLQEDSRALADESWATWSAVWQPTLLTWATVLKYCKLQSNMTTVKGKVMLVVFALTYLAFHLSYLS